MCWNWIKQYRQNKPRKEKRPGFGQTYLSSILGFNFCFNFLRIYYNFFDYRSSSSFKTSNFLLSKFIFYIYLYNFSFKLKHYQRLQIRFNTTISHFTLTFYHNSRSIVTNHSTPNQISIKQYNTR